MALLCLPMKYLKSVDRELIGYLQNDKLDIFAQPLPLETDIRQLDVNNPADYTFHFEIGMKPEFQLPDLAKAKITRYVVTVTDEMINNEIDPPAEPLWQYER